MQLILGNVIVGGLGGTITVVKNKKNGVSYTIC